MTYYEKKILWTDCYENLNIVRATHKDACDTNLEFCNKK